MKKITKKLLNKLGYSIINLKYNNSHVSDFKKDFLLLNFYETLKKINFHPNHIVDVGANHGTWTRLALQHFPEAHYTLLEPQDWLKESFQDILIKNPRVRFYPYGAGSKEGVFKFTISDRDDSSSFRYTDEQANSEGLKQIDIPIVTLNGLLNDNDLPVPDIIKIDAEGLDLEVLKGASNFFGKTEIFMVEAAVVCKELENSFFNVVDFMNSMNYRLFEITDLNRPFSPNVLWLTELVFIKKNGFIDSQIIIS